MIKINKKKNGIQLKCCLIDELGFSNFKGNGFIPKYNWFENGEQICLRVEVPGNINIKCEQIRYSGEYTIIPITGEKKKITLQKESKIIFILLENLELLKLRFIYLQKNIV